VRDVEVASARSQLSILTHTTIKEDYRTAIKEPFFYRNLMILIICWSTTSFTYYLSDFHLEFYEGNIYSNAVALRVSEIIGYCISLSLISRLGLKNTFKLSYYLSALAMFFYLLPLKNKTPFYYAICVLVANLGVSITFTPLFLITNSLFHTSVVSTVFGVCNMVARFLTILAPEAAEIEGDLVIYVFLVSTFISAILS
jgi:hypothetical protein